MATTLKSCFHYSPNQRRFTNNINKAKLSSHFSFLANSSFSMLNRLVCSSSLRHCLSYTYRTNLNLSSLPRNFPYPFKRFSSRSWPAFVIFHRPIHSYKVLSMAEHAPTSTSHSHNHTNRLATEHSPYLLQHAHNPVLLNIFIP